MTGFVDEHDKNLQRIEGWGEPEADGSDGNPQEEEQPAWIELPGSW
jgi:hypothetical protein